MKCKTSISMIGISLLAALALPVQLAAQHTRYKLVDIPTLGGDKAYSQGNGPGTGQFLNSAGTVVGSSDTTTPDPNAPNCANPDCLVAHAFRWRNGVLTDLGTLQGVGSDLFTGANAINARGWTAGFSQNGDIDPVTGFPAGHAVLWKNNEIFDLGTLGTGVESAGTYIDNGGVVVGISTIDTSFDPFASFGPFSSPTHAFIWKNGGMRDLGTLGGPDSFIAGLCNDERTDLVAGVSLTNSTPNPSTSFPTLHAFLWEDGAMLDIPTLGGTFAVAQCPNNQGQVIGTSNLKGDPGCNGSLSFCDQHTFLWDHGTLRDLGTLGGTFSVPFWLNEAGEAVGGATTPGDQAFHATLWKDGVITDLGTLVGDCFSQALAINSQGQIVGESFNCDTNTLRAVLWDKGSIIDLNAAIPPNSSLQLRETFNINDRGEIVGEGFPVGCNDVNVCGHSFLLIPCDPAGDEDCSPETATPGDAALSTNKRTTSTQRRLTSMQMLAAWRARLAQRYHIPGSAAPLD